MTSMIHAPRVGGFRVRRKRCMTAAVVVAVLATWPAVSYAGTSQRQCNLNDGATCTSDLPDHYYDDAGAYAPNAPSRYICSWIVSYAGTVRAYSCANGTTYAYYRDNNDTTFYGKMRNSSGVSPVFMQGTWHY